MIAALAEPARLFEAQATPSAREQRPRVLVFDSGLGGLTVLAEIVKALPSADLTFLADDEVFPYGRLSEEVLVARVVEVMAEAIERWRPDAVVIACNTASTIVLGPLRARWPAIAFVGTVPAIKPAAAASLSKLISVLATPGTVAREYTRGLIREFSNGCAVTLVGATNLARFAEAIMRGETIDDGAIRAEIAPAFVEVAGRRTDAVVLACTHYPLLVDRFERLAPWPVTWIDPAPAIARRTVQVLRDHGCDLTLSGSKRAAPIPAIFTSGHAPNRALATFLEGRGLRVDSGEHETATRMA